MSPGIQEIVARYLLTCNDDVVVDFEAYYDDICTVKKLGNYAYFRHPKSDIYLVSIFGRGIHFVGHPTEAPWHLINGRRWLAHSAGFDSEAYEFLQGIGGCPKDVNPSCWIDTADLSAYLGYPRNLAGCVRHLFGVTLNKAVRDSMMKGRYWWQFSDEEKAAIIQYADDDAIAWCVWQELCPLWPEHEQWLSAHTLRMAKRGIPCDPAKIDAGIDTLLKMIFELERLLPWLGEDDENGKPYALQSRAGIKMACDLADVPVPASTSMKNQEFLDWLDEYGTQVPSLVVLTRYRRTKRQLDVYQAMRTRIRADGRVDAGLKYYGADATGRWAGGGGFNLQNFLRLPLYCTATYEWSDVPVDGGHTLDVRACIVASEGNVLIIPDLSQIEPRVLNWAVGNKAFLDLVRSGYGTYEAHAKESGYVWEGKLKKVKPHMYALFKARFLALGYGAGWRKFIAMAALYITDKAEFDAVFAADVTPEQEAAFIEYLEWLVANMGHAPSRAALKTYRTDLDAYTKKVWINSWLQVSDFRNRSPLLASNDKKKPGLWKTLGDDFKASLKDQYYELELPSGRSLRYFDVSDAKGWTARRTRGGKPDRVYGGLITENMTQAIARDVFAHGIRLVEEAGFKIIFHVHDEIVVEAPVGTDPAPVMALLCAAPSWALTLPVASEAAVSGHYLK